MSLADPEVRAPKTPDDGSAASTVLVARDVSQRFGAAEALKNVSIQAAAGEIHAILGPNGAGKTTLIRILAGLLRPTSGSVEVAGFRPSDNARGFRRQIGFVAPGDRTFYLRLSGLENLVFFARLHGMRRRHAVQRSLEVLSEVGLADAARRRVGEYSHGMQKRLSVARALLTSPPVLLIDEATHDLDPQGARRVRDLVEGSATSGAAVIWVTQRLEEIRGFAHVVTLLSSGNALFTGSVAQLSSYAAPRRFILHLDRGDATLPDEHAVVAGANLTRISEPGSEHYKLSLAEDVVLGDVLAALTRADIRVLSCQEERSEIEEAFLLLVDGAER